MHQFPIFVPVIIFTANANQTACVVQAKSSEEHILLSVVYKALSAHIKTYV